ncbi:MAG TPA: bifunctional demethylmenaquinone methyltransferase/2-methoxy-6-polyprenyl-1,4-benzoquinol methylase UbiE [Chthoniobacterales bacterium]
MLEFGTLNTSAGTTQPARVRWMFSAIARRYDLANHLLSCGADFSWRNRAATTVANWRPAQIVDLATGTGDLAFALSRKLPQAEITGVDFSEEMLARARGKGLRRTILADAMQLPLASASVDCVTIAFGLRNLSDYGGGLRETHRVLRSGGHLLVLEFSLPRVAMLRAIYRFYLHRCLPVIGALLTGERGAYRYLGESIEQFPDADAMLHLLEQSGFQDSRVEPLSGGIVTIYTAGKSL